MSRKVRSEANGVHPPGLTAPWRMKCAACGALKYAYDMNEQFCGGARVISAATCRVLHSHLTHPVNLGPLQPAPAPQVTAWALS